MLGVNSDTALDRFPVSATTTPATAATARPASAAEIRPAGPGIETDRSNCPIGLPAARRASPTASSSATAATASPAASTGQRSSTGVPAGSHQRASSRQPSQPSRMPGTIAASTRTAISATNSRAAACRLWPRNRARPISARR